MLTIKRVMIQLCNNRKSKEDDKASDTVTNLDVHAHISNNIPLAQVQNPSRRHLIEEFASVKESIRCNAATPRADAYSFLLSYLESTVEMHSDILSCQTSYFYMLIVCINTHAHHFNLRSNMRLQCGIVRDSKKLVRHLKRVV